MKRLVSALVLSCCVAMFGFAQDANTEKKPEMKTEKKEMTKGENKWHGYVVDAMCAKTILKKDNIMERAAKHTKDCALEDACSATGYGLFYDNKYYKFDEAGVSVIAKVEQLHILITDTAARPDVVDELRRRGVDVRLV